MTGQLISQSRKESSTIYVSACVYIYVIVYIRKENETAKRGCGSEPKEHGCGFETKNHATAKLNSIGDAV